MAPHLPVHAYVAAAPMANDKIGASLLDSISASLQALKSQQRSPSLRRHR
ncbi:hypothetical protein VRC35_00360 [Erwinia aphidicola]